jgi:hypothetical protein
MKSTEATNRPIRASYSHAIADERKANRRHEAFLRHLIYDSMSRAEKIQLAMSRRGSSKRELARLSRS